MYVYAQTVMVSKVSKVSKIDEWITRIKVSEFVVEVKTQTTKGITILILENNDTHTCAHTHFNYRKKRNYKPVETEK